MQSVAPLALSLLTAVGCGASRTDARSETATSSRPSLTPCPEEMVLVAGRFCVDRYEAAMVDQHTGQMFSPFYPPALEEMQKAVRGQPWGLAAIGRALPIWPAAPRRHTARPLAGRRIAVLTRRCDSGKT